MLFGNDAKEVHLNLSNSSRDSVVSGIYEYTASDRIKIMAFYKDYFKTCSKSFENHEIALKWLQLIHLE